MQKLFSLKLITRNPRKIASQTLQSNPLPLHRPTNVPPHHHHHHRGFSRYTTYSQPLRQAPTNSFMKVVLKQVLLNRLFPNALLKLKATSKFLVDHGKLGFPRAQFSRKSFPLLSYLQTWQSQISRRLTSDGVILGIIVANVAVFMLWRVADRKFMMQNFMIQLDNFKSGRFHTMITSAFSHIEAGHIVSNMMVLYFFGKSIGRHFGPQYLLKLYLAGAFVGSAFFLVHHAFLAPSSKDKQLSEPETSRVPGLGASGAVNAIMLLDIFLFPTKIIYVDFVIPVPAILVGIFVVGHDIMRILQGNSQISGSAHLGGAAVAAIAWLRLLKGRF